ncbi:hypothetical protein OF001_U30038 [Pseudomonas sp. OF001]|nr:hypothetical protein OF001_U30038 [Pseudomonas sp. OF001]
MRRAQGRRRHRGDGAGRGVRAAQPGRRLPAVRRRQRGHPGAVDPPFGAACRLRPRAADLRQPRRGLGDLPRRAEGAGERPPEPPAGDPLAGLGAGHPRRRAARRTGAAVQAGRGLHLRPRTVHGRRGRCAAQPRRAQRQGPRRALRLAARRGRAGRGGGQRGGGGRAPGGQPRRRRARPRLRTRRDPARRHAPRRRARAALLPGRRLRLMHVHGGAGRGRAAAQRGPRPAGTERRLDPGLPGRGHQRARARALPRLRYGWPR